MTMMDNELIDIFDDCLNRLAAGETVEQCLRRYAAYDAALRPMLQTVRLAQRALPDREEFAPAQARGRALVLAALGETAAPKPRTRIITPRWWLAVAALLLVCFGVGAMTLNSLPGDTLYGLKRSAEATLIGLSGNNADALEAARQRRIDEVFLLVALGRPANVAFEGDVEAQTAEAWRVSGLALALDSRTLLDATIGLGDRVAVNADVTSDRRIVAREIRLLQAAEPEETPEPTPLPTGTATDAPTLTLAATDTAEPAASATPQPTNTALPTVSATLQPTTAVPASRTPLATRTVVTATTVPTRSTVTPTTTVTSNVFIAPTWTPVATRTPSPTPAETLLPAQRANCSTLRPSGWVTYNVRSGDSLFGLASSTGTSISMIMQLNCLPESGLILVGQPLYLPVMPPARPPVVNSAPAGGNTASVIINPPAQQQPALSSGNGDDSSGTRSGSNSGSNSGSSGDNASDDSGDNASSTSSGDNSS